MKRLRAKVDEAVQQSEKRWLSALFDRDFYMRARHITRDIVEAFPTEASIVGVRFGNLPFSSALRCNQYPSEIQQLQEGNLFLPLWAMRPIGATASSIDPFERIYTALKCLGTNGIAVEDICGTHAMLGALDHREVYERAPPLSQQIARIVHSIQAAKRETTFTQYALMHWYWSIWRWMLDPRPATYCEIPRHGRPTPYQLFRPHPRVFDFLAQPNLRDLMCQKDEPDVRWLSEGAATIRCEWPRPLHEALSVNAITGEIELSTDAKVSALGC